MAKRLVRWRIEGESLVDTEDEERSCDVVHEMLVSTMIEADAPLGINDKIYETETTVVQSNIDLLSSDLVDRN